MAEQSPNITKLTDHLFRHEAGKMVAVLTRIFGLTNMEFAEDIVQDAFMQALKTWTYKVPENPSGWLMLTAKNKAIDLIRQNKHRKEFASQISPLLKSEYTVLPALDKLFMDYEIADSQLRMIFACCHPALSESDRIALTLKTCSGFSVQEISRALLTNEETIKKRLQRARQFISENNIQFEIPSGTELKNRLDNVLNVLYLIFNEGYSSTNSEELIRKDLCLEALRLTLLLTNQEYTRQPKCLSLVALMSLLASRFEARVDENGEIILLEDQDRSKWNKELINIGLGFLGESSGGDELSEYHLQAAIVAEHTIAKDFSSVNWPSILTMYNALLQLNSSPTVLLNRAIVISKIRGAGAAIKEIESIPEINKYLETHYLFSATLGDLYKTLNKKEEAIKYLNRAVELTDSAFEKKLLKRKIEALHK